MPAAAESLWTQKYKILSEIWKLVEYQKSCVDNNHIDAVLDILAHKQRLLSKLQEIDNQLQMTQESGDEQGFTALEAVPAAPPDLVKGCRELLEAIVKVEQECGRTLEQRRQALASELAHLHEMAQARSAYIGQGDSLGRDLDLSL